MRDLFLAVGTGLVPFAIGALVGWTVRDGRAEREQWAAEERRWAVTDVSSTDVPMRAHTDQEDR